MMVSIIIPCHNHREALWDCLYSITQQVCDWPFEAIVVDDSSDDSPQEVAAHFGATYLRVEAHNANVARNAGLAAAQGEVVVFFDADNMMYPQFLAEHVPPILSGSTDVVYSNRLTVGDNGPGVAAYDTHNKYFCDLNSLRVAPQIDTACAVRRSSLEIKPWDEQLVRYQDWDFHLTQQERGLRYLFLPDILWQYRFSPFTAGNDNRNSTELMHSFERVRHKHRLMTSSSAVVTLVLPVMGRYFSIEPLLQCVQNLDYPKQQIDILILDGSNDEHFFTEYLQPFILSNQGDYHAIACQRTYQPPQYPNYAQGDQQQRSRCAAVANIWRIAGQRLTTPYMFILEDDTLCPPDTLTKLLSHLQSNPTAMIAQGVERTRENKFAFCAWRFKADGNLTNLFYQQQDEGLTALGAGGFFCTLVRREWMTTYPFPSTLDLLGGSFGGPDIACGWDLNNRGYLWLMDWSIRCEHLTMSNTGRVFSLSLNSYDEPDQLFLQRQLPADMYEPAEVTSSSGTIQKMPLTVILHHISGDEQVMEFMANAGLDVSTRYIVSQSVLECLNTVLHKGAAPGYIIVARGDITPPANLALIAYTQTSSATPVVFAPTSHQLFTDGFNLFTHAKQGQTPLAQLDFCVIYNAGSVWPQLPTSTNLESLVWAKYLAKHGIKSQVMIGFATAEQSSWWQELAHNRSQFFYTLGQICRSDLTLSSARRFVGVTLKVTLSAKIKDRLYWWWGYYHR